MRTLVVYCGSNIGVDPSFQESIYRFADAMASAEIDLIYGGSKSGLMGCLADRLLLHNRQYRCHAQAVDSLGASP